MTSARAFFSGIIDYAGLFPPARLGMDAAVAAYSKYRSGPDRDLLGRFVVPVASLDDLAASLERAVISPPEPWRLSCIAIDAASARSAVEAFKSAHGQLALCDTIEMPVTSSDDVNRAVDSLPAELDLFLEPSTLENPQPLIRAIAATRASAKIRTGGILASAIPQPAQIVRFMEACIDEGLAFKATAGLHHAIRGSYPLTYERGSPSGVMFGFLNVFLAAALCASGSSESAVLGALEETDAAAFRFDDNGAWWRDRFVQRDQLAVVRQNVAVSFGSCSFSEPVDEAKALHII